MAINRKNSESFIPPLSLCVERKALCGGPKAVYRGRKTPSKNGKETVGKGNKVTPELSPQSENPSVMFRSRRSARAAVLQALYQCDSLSRWHKEECFFCLEYFGAKDLDNAPSKSKESSHGVVDRDFVPSALDPILAYTKSSPANSEEIPTNSNDISTLAFAIALVEGVVTHRLELESAIEKAASHWSLNRMARVDRNILRLGAFEILYMSDVPPSVSINEAIELAKRFGSDESAGFINGVLDAIIRSLRSAHPSLVAASH